MAFPLVASVSSTAYTGTGTIVVPAPTGMAVGDLLIAQGVTRPSAGGGGASLITAPAGWSTLFTSGSAAGFSTWRKFADSTDVSNGNFTFTNLPIASSADSAIVAITRITGANATAPIFQSSHNSATVAGATASGSGFTTTRECLYLMLIGGMNTTTSRSTSGYVISPNNPTWTEYLDMDSTGTSGTNHCLVAAAWANALVSGNVSTASATFSGNENEWDFALLAIRPLDVVPTPIIGNGTVNSVSFIRKILVGAVSAAATVGNAVVSATGTAWNSVSKIAASWTNLPKI